MVDGKTQSIDSAFIKANASLENMKRVGLNVVSKEYLDRLTENEKEEIEEEIVKKKVNKRSKSKLKYNERFVSRTDPDARVSQKRGKVSALNHLGIISVDTRSHIICGAVVDFADKRDSETMEKIVGQTIENLQEFNIRVDEVLADTGYSSGESYRYLEKKNIKSYIPVHGSYKSKREGFTYLKEEDCYICQFGTKLPFKKIKQQKNRNTLEKVYRTSAKDCRGCALKKECCKNRNHKHIEDSVDKEYYDAAYAIMKTPKGKKMIKVRASTVEPVWGTLLNYRRMKKVYTKGNELANKQLLMASEAYNLKKLMNFNNRIKPIANAMKNSLADLKLTAINLRQSILDLLHFYFVRFELL